MAKRPCSNCGTIRTVTDKSRQKMVCLTCRRRLSRTEKIELGIVKPQKQYPNKDYSYRKVVCAGACGRLIWKSKTSAPEPKCRECRKSASLERIAAKPRTRAIQEPVNCARPDCGVSFTRRCRGRDANRYCSRQCSSKHRAEIRADESSINRPKTCRVYFSHCAKDGCGSIFCAQTSRVMYCSDECRRIVGVERANARNKRTRDSRPPHVVELSTCSTCGERPVRHHLSPYCDPCFRVNKRGKKDARSRARHHGVHYEPVNAAEVMRRDGWMCHLCGDPIDPESKWPDQMCASLDHVIPMAHGGPHTYDNVAASHWLCNVYKSDRAEIHFRIA